jgi:hypothetical protein
MRQFHGKVRDITISEKKLWDKEGASDCETAWFDGHMNTNGETFVELEVHVGTQKPLNPS